jgi:lysophospholipase L1-like esterase
VKIFFIFALFLVSGTEGLALASELKIIALGDSTTAGTPYYRSPVESPPRGSGDEKASYPYWLGVGHPEWTVENHGVNGQRSDEIASRFENTPMAGSVVIVLAGVNDLYQGYPSAHVKSSLRRVYETAARRKMKVVACTILPYNESGALVRERMGDVNAWIKRYAAENGLLYCDTHALASDSDRSGKLAGTPDGLHPDRDTYKKIGLALADILLK